MADHSHNPDPREWASSSLPRRQRRAVEAQLRRLMRSDNCSICGSPLPHNSRTVGGLDAQGNVVLAGECCIDRVVKPFTMGFYCDRCYDFMVQGKAQAERGLPPEQILDAIAAYQKVVANTDERLDAVERRGGGVRVRGVSLLDHPWKDNDRSWFEQNPRRSHRWRMPFSGEVDEQVAQTPAGLTLIVLVRQVEPGSRLKTVLYLNADWLPLPDNEAVAHALFDVGVGHEPVPRDRQALCALVEKYTAHGGQSDA
jgi:hypothetical protein